MDSSMNECSAHTDDLKPNSRLDFLAEKVLSACHGLQSELPESCYDNLDQPYLGAIEKILDIDHQVVMKISPDTEKRNEKISSNLLTCTDTTSYFGTSNRSNNIGLGSNEKSQDFWVPLLSNVEMKEIGGILPCLEDYAPFTDEFYRCVGQMIVCAFSTASGPYRAEIQKDNDYDDGHPRENYSLFQSIDAVRITHILTVLMDLNVNGTEKKKYTLNLCPDDTLEESDQVSFLDLLLHYTEGSSHVIINDSTSSEEGVRTPQKSVPLLNSIFKHLAALPQLENHVHTMTRLFRASAPHITNDARSTSLKIEHMKKTEAYQERLEEELRRHIASLERITAMVYERGDYNIRTKSRLRLGSLLHTFSLVHSTSRGSGLNSMHLGQENTGAAFVDSILKIILRILKGIPQANARNGTSALAESYRHLFRNVLLPLHKPSGIILWRDQQPLLSLYHKTLVQCIGAIVTIDKNLIAEVIQYILHPDVWPFEGQRQNGGSRRANTPKLVLLLHEIDTYIGLLDVDGTNSQLSDMVLPLVLRLCTCISSDNSRSSERALEFFKNESFKNLVRSNLSTVITPLLRALCRVDAGMEVPWNPTVRKMTLLVLRELESFDKVLFEESCQKLFLFEASGPNKSRQSPSNTKPSTPSIIVNHHQEAPTESMISIKNSMGSWKPPTQILGSVRNNASDNEDDSSHQMPPPMPRVPKNFKSGPAQPPLTVTGIAPWAIKSNPPQKSKASGRLMPISSEPRHNGLPSLKRKGSISSTTSSRLDENHSNTDNENSLSRIRKYIEKLKPSSSESEGESEDGISSWAKAQARESPVLLPDLKFHDLVFGDVLGTGAFSTVKYARQITKGKTRSHWPEFACKVVSTQKIEELGYEKSINREVAILRIIGHPCVARLISSFRFKDGAYLVLEYASGGDLHTLLKRNGSLDEDSTRFVIGEVISALHYIHELGLVYGDLKPENILITEIGHVKVTDFGGCRPITKKARDLVRKACTNLKSLRDGDWRAIRKTVKSTDDMSIDSKSFDDVDDEDDDNDDIRVEGTTAFLPPEVVLGSIPTKAADSWALGCVLFQCLSGRPPLLDTNEMSTRQRIVTFELSSSESADDDFFLERSGASYFGQYSKHLIRRLLTKIPSERPNMSNIALDDFFQGQDVFSFHTRTPHRLDAGKVSPSSIDAKWSRRQFSSIWAPQPQEYEISKNVSSCYTDRMDAPIPEKEERESLFLTAVQKPLTRITERVEGPSTTKY